MRLASCTLKLEFAKFGIRNDMYTKALAKPLATNKYLKDSLDKISKKPSPVTRGNSRDVYASFEPSDCEIGAKFEEVNSGGLEAIGDVLVRCSRMRRVDIYLDLTINHTDSIPLLLEKIGEIIETMKAWKEIGKELMEAAKETMVKTWDIPHSLINIVHAYTFEYYYFMEVISPFFLFPFSFFLKSILKKIGSPKRIDGKDSPFEL